jgi:hypothetical protein
MGGNAFKSPDGETLSSSIMMREVQPTVDQFLKNILRGAGVAELELLGSSGKRQLSGDIDVAVGPVPVDMTDQDFKAQILAACRAKLGDEHAKLVGQNIAVNYPIVSSDPERRDKRVQVDLMLSRNPEHTAWLMSGTGDAQIKGVFRNLLLSYIAKKQSAMTGDKITVAFPGGVQVVRGDEVILNRTEDPATIIRVLGLDADPKDLTDFERVFDAAQEKVDMSEFENYISAYMKRDPVEGGRVMAILKGKQTETPSDLQERLIRTAIRALLRV